MVRLVTLTPWSTRLVTVWGSTTCSGAYQRLSRATTRVWRRSPQWRLEIFVKTPIPPPSTKVAMTPIQAMKPAAVSISHTHRLTTTWATQVRRYHHICSAFVDIDTYVGCSRYILWGIHSRGAWTLVPWCGQMFDVAVILICTVLHVAYFIKPKLSPKVSGLLSSVSCRWRLYRFLYTEPGCQNALLPGPDLPDLATLIKTSSSANGTPSGWASSWFHHPGMVSTHFRTLLWQVKWTECVAK